MSKYKITCNDPEWVGKSYHGLKFVAVAETEDDAVAREFQNRTLTTMVIRCSLLKPSMINF